MISVKDMARAAIVAAMVLAGGVTFGQEHAPWPTDWNNWNDPALWVPVGNPGNTGELSGSGAGGYGADRICGAVGYTFNMGKFEVTAGQYTAFLNAVGATDTYELYYFAMDTAVYGLGCNIKRTGSSGNYTYSVALDWANRPVNFVSWGSAARFANWLTNGQPTGDQGLTTTENGSYYLNGVAPLAVTRIADGDRTPGKKYYFIPSEDEWYKAAYHKNDGMTGNYFDYPTGSDSVPSNDLITLDPGNNANVSQSGATIGEPYWRTEVGDFENSQSPYGTFDQGGNVSEWNEAIGWWSSRGLRGGAYIFPNVVNDLHAANRFDASWGAAGAYGEIGFRVSEVPEPATLSLLALGGLGVFLRRKRQLLAALGGFVLAIVLLSQPALAGPYPQTREYMLGDIDGIHYDGPGSVDDVYVDPNMIAYLQQAAPAEDNDHFDVLHSNNNVPFTFVCPLTANEEVTGGTLTLGLRATDPLVTSDELGFMNLNATQLWKHWFSDLGWLPIADTGMTVRSVDLANVEGSSYISLLQEGKLNVCITDDCAVDYANLTIEVMPEFATLSLLVLGGLMALRRRR